MATHVRRALDNQILNDIFSARLFHFAKLWDCYLHETISSGANQANQTSFCVHEH